MNNLIGYTWKDASNKATIDVTNPATGKLIDTVPNVTLDDVDEAVKSSSNRTKEMERSLFI